VDAEQTAVALGWESIHSFAGGLAAAVSVTGPPDVIVGILRGGMIPAVILAHLLQVRDVRALSLTRTTQEGIDAPKTVRPVLVNPGSPGDLTGCDVLLVDDVAGSGDTIYAARDLMITQGAARVRTATCVLNTANWPAWRDGTVPQTPTYVGWRSQGWVIFPWETR
jgi:hypoxanthine phosphoribosyltransferase